MSDESEAKKQTEILREILKWIKFSGMKEVKEVLLNTLTDDTKKLIYHYSDGTNGTEAIKKLANVKGNGVIPSLWEKWKNLGITEKIQVQRGERGKRIFNLEDFGIPIPLGVAKVEKLKSRSEAIGETKVTNTGKEINEEITVEGANKDER